MEKISMANAYGGIEILFDEQPDGLAIVFTAEEPENEGMSNVLWWSRPTSVDEIAQVIRFIGLEGLPVSAIVIGDLADYPLSDCYWPWWLAKVACGPGPRQVIVDTTGLSPRRRRRLIDGTRRNCLLRPAEDPVLRALRSLRIWLRGWMR